MGNAERARNARAVCVVVWRNGHAQREFLILHRRYAGGIDFEGEWAWTPPAGAIERGEKSHDAAKRELQEETGLDLDCTAVEGAPGSASVFTAEAPPHVEVVLDDEHDRFLWVSQEQACRVCMPDLVAAQITAVGTALDDADIANPSY